MAEIFLAKLQGAEGFEKPVVLKRIHRAFSEDRQFRGMLIDEAHVSMGLTHNNIVQILDVGRGNEQFFLVLELVDGWDLARLIERAHNAGRPLPLGLGLYIVAEVCRALAYAHDKTSLDGRPLGLVHRDVSPQNVLVSQQGEVKLGDFGIAKAMTKREHTASGVVKGKVSFMSPEQALGQPLDGRSDLFSIGSMLYLLATGKRPFDAPTELEVLLRVQTCEYPAPEAVKPDISPALAEVIRRALSKDRENRYQTADELLVDIEGVLRTEHGSAGQTELKLWLAELARADGMPPISRRQSAELPAAESSDELVEGNSVQLRDDVEESGGRDIRGLEDGGLDGGGLDGGIDGAPFGGLGRPAGRARGEGSGQRRATAPTIAVKVDGASSSPRRLTGVEATAITDLELSVPHDDGPPEDRLVRDARRRAIRYVIVATLFLAGAGYGAWRVFGPELMEEIKAAQEGPGATGAVEREPSAAPASEEGAAAGRAEPKAAGAREVAPSAREAAPSAREPAPAAREPASPPARREAPAVPARPTVTARQGAAAGEDGTAPPRFQPEERAVPATAPPPPEPTPPPASAAPAPEVPVAAPAAEAPTTPAE